MNIRDVVTDEINKRGAAGLVCPGRMCDGCFLDDLMPCDEPFSGCVIAVESVDDDGEITLVEQEI